LGERFADVAGFDHEGPEIVGINFEERKNCVGEGCAADVEGALVSGGEGAAGEIADGEGEVGFIERAEIGGEDFLFF